MSLKQSETDFQQSVIQAAQVLGWMVAHFRGVRVQRKDGSIYYQTPVQADGSGWPDLVLVRGFRIIFAELKSETGKVSLDQQKWLDALGNVGDKDVEVWVWRPSDWDTIMENLSRR